MIIAALIRGTGTGTVSPVIVVTRSMFAWSVLFGPWT